ncbi:hypothetical protein TcCL_ESM06748 [Trypanosoma cruzi]|nr:hypothetical protein TcCL_ESM06748 [Trypanosoma cruzi]
MPLNPGRKRPQPSQVANNGKCVKEEHSPHKGRLCSCRVATRSIVVVNRRFSPPQPKKLLSIHLLLWTKRPRLFRLNHRTSATGILRERFACFTGGRRRERGPPDESTNLHEPLQGSRVQPTHDPLWYSIRAR